MNVLATGRGNCLFCLVTSRDAVSAVYI